MYLCLALATGCVGPNEEHQETGNDHPASVTPNIDPGAGEMIPDDLILINTVRKKGCTCGGQVMPPVPPLKWNSLLVRAASNHARDMERNAYFDHTSPSGSTPGVRAQEAGYAWMTVAENIAKGQPSAQIVMESWLRSPGHCKNLMNPDFLEVGMANSGTYWVQVFGAR